MHEKIESLQKPGSCGISESPSFHFLDILNKSDNKLTPSRTLQPHNAQSETSRSDGQYLMIPTLHLEDKLGEPQANANARTKEASQRAELHSTLSKTFSPAKPESANSEKPETSSSKSPEAPVATETVPEQTTSVFNKNTKSTERPDKREKPDEAIKFQLGKDGKIELSEKDFDTVGDLAKKAMIESGVTKMSITPHDGFDSYHFELKAPKEVEQDPSIDGTRKLKVGTEFNFDLKHNKDGSLSMSNIEGLTAESNILRKFRDAEVQSIQIEKTEDGESKISSTGTWNGFSRTKIRTEPGEIFNTANLLYDRIQKLKESLDK